MFNIFVLPPLYCDGDAILPSESLLTRVYRRANTSATQFLCECFFGGVRCSNSFFVMIEEDGLIIIISLLYRSYCCCVLIFIIVVFCTYQIDEQYDN